MAVLYPSHGASRLSFKSRLFLAHFIKSGGNLNCNFLILNTHFPILMMLAIQEKSLIPIAKVVIKQFVFINLDRNFFLQLSLNRMYSQCISFTSYTLLKEKDYLCNW